MSEGKDELGQYGPYTPITVSARTLDGHELVGFDLGWAKANLEDVLRYVNSPYPSRELLAAAERACRRMASPPPPNPIEETQ